MSFGKFKGVELDDLPESYFLWLCSLDNLRRPLREEVQREYERRYVSSGADSSSVAEVPHLVPSLIESGFRVLARKHHPDVGGTDQAMRDVLDARQWLEQIAGHSK